MRRRRTAAPGGAGSASHRHDDGARAGGSMTRLRPGAASKPHRLYGIQERQALA
ncbi:hypothetical protein ABZ915_33720 [Streptomyces sp. NPDC046915]|uniref:hypothetical protein n=1 Tax=Streptomyces sp. NPDC046915 TaxID=3155257 RepID=UPI0034028463